MFKLNILQSKMIRKLFKYINKIVNISKILYCFKIREPIIRTIKTFGSVYNLTQCKFNVEYNRNWYKSKRYELMKFSKFHI